MTEFRSIVEVQVHAMLDGIRQDVEQRRETILAEAREQARLILKNVRRQCRTRVAQAVVEERDHRDRSLQKAAASLASRIRRKRQALDREQLALGYDSLRAALLARWQDADARVEWARALLAEAHALLPDSTWQVEYPASLEADEARRLLEASTSGHTVSLAPAGDLDAGFRLLHEDARLDMSVEGLLAQTGEMAAALLAEIHRQEDIAGAGQ